MSVTEQLPGPRVTPRRIIAVACVAVALTVATILIVSGGSNAQVTAAFALESTSNDGYAGRFILGNDGAEITDGWRIEFDLPPGTEVTGHWDASMQRTGQHYAFTQGQNNAAIPEGGSVSFGFAVTGSGKPINCTFQGTECVTPTDETPPAQPQSLRVTGLSVSDVALAWDPPDDDVGVVGYRIFSETGDGALVAVSPVPSTVIKGLTPGMKYTFSVSALDADGNQSTGSTPVTMTTLAGDDSERPSPPGNVHAHAADSTTVSLTWDAAEDNVGVAEYRVRSGRDVLASSAGLSVTIAGLSPGTTYKLQVVAVDEAENESAASEAVTVATPAGSAPGTPTAQPGPPTAPPSRTKTTAPHQPTTTLSVAPSGVQGTAATRSAPVLLSKNKSAIASSEGVMADGTAAFGAGKAFDGDLTTRWASRVGIDPSWLRVDLGAASRISKVVLRWDKSCARSYTIETSTNGVLWTKAFGTEAGDGGVDDIGVGAMARYVQVVGMIRCGTRGYSLQEMEVYGLVDVTVPNSVADKQSPTVPADAKATQVSTSSAVVSWAASRDNVGVVGYDVYRDDHLLRTVDGSTTSVALTGLAPNTQYRLTIRARDAAGGTSAPSNAVQFTTEASGDTAPPEAPGSMRVTGATASTISLAWQADTDAGAVYDVYADGTKIGSTSLTTATVAGLAAETEYQFAVKARDAAGNNSTASRTVRGRTTAVGAEPAPTSAGPPSPSPRGTTAAPSPTTTGSTPVKTRLGEVSEVVQGLKVPWGVAFLPSGEALVGERDSAAVSRISPTGTRHSAGTVSGVVGTGGEGGLLGLAVSSTFAKDHWVYAYHSAQSDNRIVRMSFNGQTLGAPQLVLAGIPKNKYHNGGRITFGPNGMLYVGTGDAQSSANAQNRDSLGGKILRVTPEGKPAPGNPFNSPVFSYGHRNVQGLWFDSKNRLWASEFGNAQRDELNLIVAGKNYGWPTCEGKCGDSRFVDPKAEWPVAQASPSGICIVGDVVFMASLRGARLWRIPITGTEVEAPQSNFIGTYGRLRTIVPAPDGSLWVTTSNTDANGTPKPGDDRILRIELT